MFCQGASKPNARDVGMPQEDEDGDDRGGLLGCHARNSLAAASLGATPHARGNATNEALNEKMSEAPFTLVAVLRSGEERVLKPVHRRSRNYLNYRFNPFGQRYQLDGEWIDHFRYDDNRLAGKSA